MDVAEKADKGLAPALGEKSPLATWRV